MFKQSICAAIVLAALSTTAMAEIVINRGSGGDPKTLDQHQTSTDTEHTLLNELYEGLVTEDREGKLIPGVAQSWTISEDGLKYRFQLRKDAKWSNGAPVVARDFVYSLRRIMDPKTAAAYASILFPINNAAEVAAGKKPLQALGVTALSEHELEITLAKATPYFLEILTHQTALPLYQPSVEAHGIKFTQPGNLVSNGAYTLSRYVPNDVIVMQKNPNFWDAERVKIDRVNWMAFTDLSSCLRRFEAREVDICAGVPTDQLDHIRRTMAAEYRQSPYFGVSYLVVKGAADSKLRDMRVRQALSMIIDRKFLTETVLRGTTVAAYAMVPPGTQNYVADAPRLDFADQDMLDREDKAKALLQEAGVTPGSLTVKLRFGTSENLRNIVSAIADMARKVGIQVLPDETEPSAYYNLLKERGAYDLSYAGWIGDYNDPNTFLGLYTSGNHFNYNDWSNAEYDALIAQAETSLDKGKRAELFSKAEKILLRESAYIPISLPTTRAMVAQKVKGYVNNVRDAHATRWLSID